MRYVSTRGRSPALSFEDALISGLAPDGGLYVPRHYPRLRGALIRSFAHASYEEVAVECLAPFLGDMLSRDDLTRLVEESYKNFSHVARAPLRQVKSDLWMMELFHGPSHAFKDFALQILARLMDEALARRQKKVIIICATSGDTGAAAMAAFAQVKSARLFVLYPQGRISDVQRKQMTSYQLDHLHAIAIKGDFDDCQNLVKSLLGNPALKEELALTAVNSISWARIMAQCVYYFTACAALGAHFKRKVNFIVPTGNFGDIYAGFVAKKMGAPIDRLVIANNNNDILTRSLAHGVYRPRQISATLSPAMDIQLASNFERLLYDSCGYKPKKLNEMMSALSTKGEIRLPKPVWRFIRTHFAASSVDDKQTLAMIKRHYQDTQYLIDPHSAVGLAVAEKVKLPQGPKVVLGTAHPSKFPKAIDEALGFVPKPLKIEGEEKIDVLPKNEEALIEFIRHHR